MLVCFQPVYSITKVAKFLLKILLFLLLGFNLWCIVQVLSGFILSLIYFHFIYFLIFKLTQKKKQEGEEEAEGRNGVEDRAKYYDCDLMDSRYIFNYNNKGKIPNEETNLAPSERINGRVSENFDGISLSEVPIPTDEQAMIATPYKKLVATADGGSNDVKAFKKKKALIAQKKGSPNKENRKVKSCGMLLDDFL